MIAVESHIRSVSITTSRVDLVCFKVVVWCDKVECMGRSNHHNVFVHRTVRALHSYRDSGIRRFVESCDAAAVLVDSNSCFVASSWALNRVLLVLVRVLVFCVSVVVVVVGVRRVGSSTMVPHLSLMVLNVSPTNSIPFPVPSTPFSTS